MTSTVPVAGLPLEHTADRPFDPPAELARLREEHPITRMTYPDGHVGWLVTSRVWVREILSDRRFSARSELVHSPLPGPAAQAPRPAAPPGIFTQTDAPVHTRYRHLLTGQFTVRRMRQLTERVEEITAACLDAMEQQGPPTDLMTAFALPIPSLVICELLGVPYADRDQFTDQTAALMSTTNSREERIAAYLGVQAFLAELVKAKRVTPTDDMLGGLTTSDLTDEELTNVAFTLLGAGHETTANMLSLGTYALLGHPDQIEIMLADPNAAVEELLRYLSIIPGTVRSALEDVEVGGETIKAGESVTVSIPAANRDPERFEHPDALDVRRVTSGQVAFGHGVHQCLGQQLARVEMRVAYPALFTRFPSLRLNVAPEAVPLKNDAIIYGVHSLPVTWDS